MSEFTFAMDNADQVVVLEKKRGITKGNTNFQMYIISQ